MVCHDLTRAKLLCAKNEGIDQEKVRNTNDIAVDDTKFLNSWANLLEGISKKVHYF